jgi:hypothetical protein
MTLNPGTNLLASEYREVSSEGKQNGLETDHSPPPNAEVRSTPSLQCVFMIKRLIM